MKQGTRITIWIIVPFVLLVAGFVFTLQTLERAFLAQPVTWGVTFTPGQAEWLGLDWKETFTALLDDAGFRHLRLSGYWTDIEQIPGEYDFSRLDWQISEAEKRDAKVILAVGRRLPRWPECFEPDWVKELSEEEKKPLITDLVRMTIERYRGSRAVVAWQVENEPFLPFFGECPPVDRKFVKQEVDLVRSLDNKPVMITESGELSFWRNATVLGDVVGVSIYRRTWNKYIGPFTYPLPPTFYTAKAYIVGLFGKPVLVSELSLEPFHTSGIVNITIEDMYRTMSPDHFQKNINYARRAGFTEIYMWGGEWWYWMKEANGIPVFWNMAKSLVQTGEL